MVTKKEVLLTTVYGKPHCKQCDATTRELDKKKLPYTYVDMSEEPEAMNLVKALGYLQAPVVVADENHWSGFRPDLIAKHLV